MAMINPTRVTPLESCCLKPCVLLSPRGPCQSPAPHPRPHPWARATQIPTPQRSHLQSPQIKSRGAEQCSQQKPSQSSTPKTGCRRKGDKMEQEGEGVSETPIFFPASCGQWCTAGATALRKCLSPTPNRQRRPSPTLHGPSPGVRCSWGVGRL